MTSPGGSESLRGEHVHDAALLAIPPRRETPHRVELIRNDLTVGLAGREIEKRAGSASSGLQRFRDPYPFSVVLSL
jgi:hypothetical protein